MPRPPKQTHHFSVHLPAKLHAIVEEQKKTHGSRNAYIAHCIEMERALASKCDGCDYRDVAEKVLGVFHSVGAKLEKVQKRKR